MSLMFVSETKCSNVNVRWLHDI